MFNGCMQNTGPPPGINPMPPQNGPPNLNDGGGGFYSPAPPHFEQAPHPGSFNQIRINDHIRNVNNLNNMNMNNSMNNINPMNNMNTRPPPNYCPPIYEFKICELVKRLTERPDTPDNLWWEQFTTEFFDDHSTLTIHFAADEGPKQHTIGRTLIPRYFRTMLENVQDFSIRLKRPFIKELPNRTATLDCEQCTLITQFNKPTTYNKSHLMYPMDPLMMKENKEIGLIVTTDGRLVLEFVQNESLKIRSWNFTTTNFQEFLFKNLVAMHAQDPSLLELTKNITKQGLTKATVDYLGLCILLEPMQLIMTRYKEIETSTPRDSLKNVLYNKWQANVCQQQETQRQPKRQRKRNKSTQNAGGSKKKNNAQMSPGTPNFPLATQDVMVVGEPSLMGGEFGDEDERLITRLENNQFDSSAVPTNGLENDDQFAVQTNQSNINQPQNQQQMNQPPSNQQNQWQINSGPPTPLNQVPGNGQIGNNSNNGPNGSINGSVNVSNQIEDKKPLEPISQ